MTISPIKQLHNLCNSSQHHQQQQQEHMQQDQEQQVPSTHNQGSQHLLCPPPHTQGPNLGGIFGRQSGQAAGFAYSKANKEKAVIWKEETLYDYLLNPKK